jgi:dipeptidyl aminopeptidase/acylaminoacyl peptidase
MAPNDILRIANVSDAQISPNGQWVIYTVSKVEGNTSVSRLWLSNPGPVTSLSTGQQPATTAWPNERSTPALLLASDWTGSNPRWSPDSSKIAFLSDHNAQQGIWVVSLDDRQPRFVAKVQSTNFFITYAGESLAWSPDSKRIAYVSATEEITDVAPSSPDHDDPRVIDRLQYKSRTAFSDKRRTHVWITAIDKPEPRQLTTGYFYDHAITFSPNENEIAFLSNHQADPDANNNSDIFAVDLNGQVRQITATRGCEYEPAWSPDGKWIAYTATKREITTIDSVAEDTHVWITSASGDERRELTAEQDRRVRSPRWSADSRWIVFLAGDKGETLLFRVSTAGGRIHPLWFSPFRKIHPEDASSPPSPRRSQIGSFSVAGGRRSAILFALTLSDVSSPAELWLVSLLTTEGIVTDSSKAVLHSRHNAALLNSLELVEPEELRFKSFDGTPIQGWFIKPVGWRSDRKYPLILSVHGGPHGMSGYAFNSTFQVYAARGYAVLYLNPRGSSGYGQKFSDGTLNEWGGGDYKDLMAGVDEALRKYPWIDQNRMGVTGGSYGGFMTNWIITQTPRFRAAVSVASLSNLISFYSTSLYQDLIHAEFGGFPWDNYDLLWQWSPLKYVKQAQTPTLFIHGEQDNDVHITQAEEMYTALKRRGVETVLVRYPREGHGLREPKHRVDALERTLAWFDRFLK